MCLSRVIETDVNPNKVYKGYKVFMAYPSGTLGFPIMSDENVVPVVPGRWMHDPMSRTKIHGSVPIPYTRGYHCFRGYFGARRFKKSLYKDKKGFEYPIRRVSVKSVTAIGTQLAGDHLRMLSYKAVVGRNLFIHKTLRERVRELVHRFR